MSRRNTTKTEIEQMRKNARLREQDYQKECLHHSDREYYISSLSKVKSFRRDNTQYPKSTLYCEECGKVFDGESFSKDTVEDAIWVIEGMFEQLKVMGNLNDKQLDQMIEVIDDIAVIKHMAIYYDNLNNKDDRDKNKKRNNNNSGRKKSVGVTSSMFNGAGRR